LAGWNLATSLVLMSALVYLFTLAHLTFIAHTLHHNTKLTHTLILHIFTYTSPCIVAANVMIAKKMGHNLGSIHSKAGPICQKSKEFIKV
jgi:hypothetical protein